MTQAAPALWITEAEVSALIDMPDAIDALERGLEQEAAGVAHNMAKTHRLWGGANTLHAIGAVFETAGFAATKTWAHTEGGATPLLVMFDAKTGALQAIIEAFVLGQLRTGGLSGVAAKLMSSPQAASMCLIGAGKQGLAQIASVAAVRPLESVRIWSPNAEHRTAFAAKATAELGFEVRATPTLAAALDGAEIITLATRATQPFLTSAMVAPGAHINAVGAITPERAEFEPGLLRRCATVAVDSLVQVRRLSQEFVTYYGEDEAAWSAVRPLCELTGGKPPPSPGEDVTLFKAMGVGISDLSLGVEILQRARNVGAGRPVPHPQKVAPRLVRRPPTEETRS